MEPTYEPTPPSPQIVTPIAPSPISQDQAQSTIEPSSEPSLNQQPPPIRTQLPPEVWAAMNRRDRKRYLTQHKLKP